VLCSIIYNIIMEYDGCVGSGGGRAERKQEECGDWRSQIAPNLQTPPSPMDLLLLLLLYANAIIIFRRRRLRVIIIYQRVMNDFELYYIICV